MGNSKAKQPVSGDLCGNITEFGVAEGSPEPEGILKAWYDGSAPSLGLHIDRYICN